MPFVDDRVPPERAAQKQAEPGLLRQAGAMAAGIGAPVLGGIVGGIPGAVVGGAVGEAARERILGEPTDWKDIALSGAAAAIPAGVAGKFVKGPVSGAVARGLEGVAIGGGYEAAREALHGEPFDSARITTSAGVGGVLGGPLGALEGRGAARGLKQSAAANKAARNAVDSIGTATVGGLRSVRDALNPTGAAPAAGVDVLMKAKGWRDFKLFRQERATRPGYHYFDKNINEGIPFISNLQRGQAQATPELQAFDKQIRTETDWLFNEINKYRKLQHREDYFPGLWKNQKAYEAWALSRRPYQGSRKFFNQKVFDTIDEGIRAGFEPVSKNPFVLLAAYRYDATKFLMAQEAWQGLKDTGFRKWVPHGTKVPDGWARVDDAIARKFFPKDVAQVVIGGKVTNRPVEAGEWVVEKNVAKLLNNHLSRDLIRDHPTLRGVLAANNHLNGLQLGLSLWHATFTAVDSAASEAGLAVARAARAVGKFREGDIAGAAKQLGKAARHSLTAAVPLVAPVKYVMKGREFFERGAGTQLEKQLAAGGAKLQTERQYFFNDVWKNFLSNVRQGDVGGAIVRAPFAIVEASMRPLFEYAIPRMKVGAFSALMESELERNADKIAAGTLSEATLSRNVWANIENRLGELNYDNLFWNRTFKTAAQMAFRAVGFNVGTVRELGGGIVHDFPAAIGKLARGRAPELTPKMQYTLGLMTTVAGLGGMYHYLHTGQKPEKIVDYYYPKNGTKDEYGNDVRVQLPTYFKDFWGATHHPVTMVQHKLSPLATTITELLSNRDFMNDHIYNEQAALPTKARQVASYLINEFEPFSFRQYGELGGEKPFTPQKFEASIGITRAPREVSMPPGLAAAQAARAAQAPGRGPRTPEQKETQLQRRQTQNALQQTMGFQVRPEDRAMQQLPPPVREQLRAEHPELAQRPGADPITQELLRLSIPIPQAHQKVQLAGASYVLPAELAAQLAQQQGQLIKQQVGALMASPYYARAPLKVQRDNIRNAVTRARKVAWARMKPQLGKLLKQGALKRSGTPEVELPADALP